MLEVAKTSFAIGVPSLPVKELESYSSSLFDTWDGYIDMSLKVPDYSILLEIEEGSIKGTGCIAVALYALYMGIGNYGSFISGLQAIGGQLSYVNSKLAQSASAPFGGDRVKTSIRSSGGTVSQLRRLFHRVQQGDLTGDQAFSEAARLLGDDAGSSPEFMKALRHELENAPRYPEQISLVDELDLDEAEGLEELPIRHPPRIPRPKPDVPTNQFRVEIWRESKKLKRNIKLTKL